MDRQRTMDFLAESVCQFENEEALQNKVERFKKQSRSLPNRDPNIAVLADSRILIPPEYIFAQNLCDVYCVQSILDNGDSAGIVASVEYGISTYGCEFLVLALPANDNQSISEMHQDFLQVIGVLKESNMIRGLLNNNDLEIATYMVDSANRSVGKINLESA